MPGTIPPGEEQGREKTFVNLAAFGQALWDVTDELGATAGVRVDDHNVFGTHVSPRLGVVWAGEEPAVNVKLLYGTSFKAPSAEQLYSQPIRAFDVRGNEQLRAQTASTGELAAGVRLGSLGEVSANVYLTEVEGRVEFKQRALFLTAENSADELFAGGELDARLRLLDPLTVRLGAGYVTLLSREEKAAEELIEAPKVELPLFPALQAHLLVDFLIPVVHLRLSPELSYVGPRQASQSNALQHMGNYELDAYFYTAVALSLPEQKLLGDRPTSASLRVTNLLDEGWPEPGFGGIDLPGQGRTVLLTVRQGL